MWSSSADYDKLKTTSTDPNGNISESHVDVFGNLVKVVDHLDNGGSTSLLTTTYEYDEAHNLIEVNPTGQGDNGSSNGDIIDIGYDWLGRKLTMDDPDSGSWSYTYDDNGNLKTQDGPRSGDDLYFTYNKLGGLESVRAGTSSSGKLLKDWVWDSHGRLGQLEPSRIGAPGAQLHGERYEPGRAVSGRLHVRSRHLPGRARSAPLLWRWSWYLQHGLHVPVGWRARDGEVSR